MDDNARLRTGCPSADVLARVAAGEADESERTTLIDHLGECLACSEEYRVAAALGPWARGAAMERLPDVPRDHALRTASPRWPVYAAAAAAILAVAATAWALALWADNARLAAEVHAAISQRGATSEQTRGGVPSQDVARLQARLEQAQAPAVNVPIIDLEAGDALRTPGRRPPIRVPGDSRFVTFVLTPSRDPANVPHELEIVGPTGTLVWRGSGLRANPENTFTVVIPRSLLPAGTSQFKLFAQQRGTRTRVDEYAVRVDP